MNKAYDVVVIGGGAIGTACAYYLSKKGLKIALLEKKDFSSGSSCRCEGHLAVHDSEAGYFSQVSKYSLDLFEKEVIKDLDLDVHYETMGIGLLCENEDEVELVKQIMEGKKKEGIPVRFLDKYELKQEEPNIADDILGAVVYECDSKLSPMYLCYAFSEKAKKYGADIYNYTEVKDIVVDSNNSIEKVITNRGEFITKNVVNAAGVWANSIGNMVGLNIPVKPRQGQILITEKTPINVANRSYSEVGYIAAKKGKKRASVTEDMEKYGVALVIEKTMDENYLLGSSRVFCGYNIKTSIEIMQAIAQRAMRFFPILKDINIIRSYAGLRPTTPDGYPIVSKTDIKGFYIAVGHEGNGISLSPFTGKSIASLIMGIKPEVDVSPFDITRFK